MAQGAELVSGDLAGVVLARARPMGIPTIVWRALSQRAKVGGHRHIHPFRGVTAMSVRTADERPLPLQVDGDYIGEFPRRASRSCPLADRRESPSVSGSGCGRARIIAGPARRGSAVAGRSGPRTRAADRRRRPRRCPVLPEANNPCNQRIRSLPVATLIGGECARSDSATLFTRTSARASTTARPIGIPYDRRVRAHTQACRSASTTPGSPTGTATRSPRTSRSRAARPTATATCSSSTERLPALRALRAYPQRAGALARRLGRDLEPPLEPPAPRGWTSADAAGLPILPGWPATTRSRPGAIDHALRFTAPRTRSAYIYPARH